MTHRTGITLRLTPADRTALEALQAFTQERTATRAINRHRHVNTLPRHLPHIAESGSRPGPGPAGAAADPGRAGPGE